MEDELVDEARLKFHSTTSEAIEVGKNMNANFTILTHFSQRYAKIPVFNQKFNDRVGIAFDNMRVRMTDLNKLPKMIPTLKCLFVDHIEELKAKTAHKIKRRELLNQYYGDISHSNRS
jgi:ribonuclease Z